jgi:hypothetical protein
LQTVHRRLGANVTGRCILFVVHNRYCSFGLALSFVIDIALVVAICKVTIFMAISAQLFSPVLLLYLAMVIKCSVVFSFL